MELENGNGHVVINPKNAEPVISTRDQITAMDFEGPTPVRFGHSLADAEAKARDADHAQIAGLVGQGIASMDVSLSERYSGFAVTGFESGGKIHISKPAAQVGKLARAVFVEVENQVAHRSPAGGVKQGS